jgi:hypothetical protein
MKRILPLVLTLSFALAGCMPPFVLGASSPTPGVDVEASVAALIQTGAAQTRQAMPSSTPLPSSTPVIAASSTRTPVRTSTGLSTATSTMTQHAGTPGNTSTLPPTPVSQTATLGAQFFGTRPPLVPSGRLILQNRAHAQVYVSFQCINEEDSLTILEYPVTRWMELKFPSGKCNYVAWVGGREFLGNFALDRGGLKTIIFFIDRIKIK